MNKSPGRPRGVKETKPRNTAARKLAAIASAQGVTPLDVMLMDMRAKLEAGDLSGAADRAESCAPYVHPRLASATLTHKDAFSELTREELEELLAFAKQAAQPLQVQH
ncbi:MAG: hypothetical protein JO212_09480 [Acetobacteraceae bacterium]|nr:hypothetical protein [Acetobacteraceae bacterium]